MTSDPTDGFARPRVAAGVLFVDEAGKVLMVVPVYKDYRDIPGGYLEQGETPREAAAREVEEELGIAPAIGRLLVIDWAPNATEGDKQLLIFDGGTLARGARDEIKLDPAELSAYEFHDVTSIHDVTIPRLARRVVHAHQARADGSVRYLEHGQLTND